MPKAFRRCVKSGGRVRTVKPTAGTYLPVCYPKCGRHPVAGHVRHDRRRR